MADSENRVIYTFCLVCYGASDKLRKLYICAMILTLLWGQKRLQMAVHICRFLLFILKPLPWHDAVEITRTFCCLSVVLRPLMLLLISPRISLNPQLYMACFYAVFLYHLSSVISQLFVTGVVKHCSDSCFRHPLYTVLPCWRWICSTAVVTGPQVACLPHGQLQALL